MDNYTKETKMWLDDRFKKTCDGIYYAHQPIYGYRAGYCEPGLIVRYIRTYHILKKLSYFNISSVLDIGAAEGYKGFLVKKLLGHAVQNTDLSFEACKRSEELFQIPAQPEDVHHLSFTDNSFDAVICSETLEHVTNPKRAIQELLRVSRHAVIITVPHENQQTVSKNKTNNEQHSHINAFSLNTLDYLLNQGFSVDKTPIISPYLHPLRLFVEASHKKSSTPHKKILFFLYNMLVPLLRKLPLETLAHTLIELDEKITNRLHYEAIVYVITPVGEVVPKAPKRNIKPTDIINQTVGYYYLTDKPSDPQTL